MVFVVVNTAVLVLRRDPVEHEHYQAPTLLPARGAVCSVALLIDKAADDITVYGYAAGLLALGAVLWGINRVIGGPHREIDPRQASRLRRARHAMDTLRPWVRVCLVGVRG